MKSIHCDRIMMTLYKNINSIMMKTVGPVVFIRLLLLIAGVEPNPGPTDKLVLMFRYQFLLIEVGTILLRKLFDNQVGNDLMTYLKTYPKCAKTLKVLLDKDIITDDQKKFLPPIDNTPDTSNFDITLLTCLLRNICGLKQHQDLVWQHPANGDLSIEADITRLKNCRNYVVHKGTVYISESDLKLKWSELCQILHRLNKFCGIPNLSEMIDDIDNKPIDEQAEKQLDNILKAWHETESMYEKGIVDMKIDLSELKDGQSELEDVIKVALSEIKQSIEDKQQKDLTQLVQTKRRLDDSEQTSCSNKRTKSDTYDDIKERLKKSYETDFSSVCVTPLYSEDDRMDMFTIYSRPKMEHVPYHNSKQREGNYKISSYEQVFCKENTTFRNVFITGDAGMGKTTFGQFMSLLWSKEIADIESDEDIQNDAKFITNFEFVFYILLKETNREDVVSMIIDKYFYTSSIDEFEDKIKTIEQILRTKTCLVILDGLDEWRPDIRGHRKLTLPRKVISDKCTFLTTCRPYRIETVRLSKIEIDHQVKITGFDAEQYVREVIVYINRSQDTNKLAEDFFEQIHVSGMIEQLQIPLIASQLIVVWFKYEMENMSKAMIYGSIVEMLFDRAIENEIKFPPVALADVHFPESFSKFTYLRQYGFALEKVCLLSYHLLFNPHHFNSPSFVFTKKQLMAKPFNISPGEIDFLCQLGIISKNKVIGNFGDQELMLSFLHMSYLEFLAALFVTLFDKNGLFPEAVKKIAIKDIHGFRNFLILLSGISPKLTNLFFDASYLVRKDEFDLLRTKSVTPDFKRGTLDIMQTHILNCFKEMVVSVSDNSLNNIRLEDFNFKSEFYEFFDIDIEACTVDQCLFRNSKALLVMNKSCVKSLITDRYLNVFTEIKGLQFLIIESDCDSSYIRDDLRPPTRYHDGFNDVLLQNNLTLHSIRMESILLSLQLPLRSLLYLTTICFNYVYIKHDVLHDLMNYISGNVLLKNINLLEVICQEHFPIFRSRCSDLCKLTLNLFDHSKLLTLSLHDINVECRAINKPSLKSLFVQGFGTTLENAGIPILIDSEKSIRNSKLKSLSLDSDSIRQSELNDVIKAIESLKYLEDLTLKRFTIPDSVTLQLHPDIVCDEHINVKLEKVRMSEKCFHEFIHSIINCQSMVRVCMDECNVRWDNPSHPNFKYGLNSIRNIPGLRMIESYGFDSVRVFEFETMK